MSDTMRQLDEFYAGALGCAPADLRAGELKIIPCASIDIKFAKGYPLALNGIDTGQAIAITVHQELADSLREALGNIPAPSLDDATCEAIEKALTPLIDSPDWFRGVRLYCDSSIFVDQRVGETRAVTHDDPKARELHTKWGGEVFGQIVDGRVVSWAAVKPISDTVWDLRVDTLPQQRGQGYAASAVSAAVRHIIDSGKIAGWGTDRNNTASLGTARKVGFADYALDFGCVIGRE